MSDEEKITEPELIRVTDTCVTWPCYVIDDVWFKAKAYFGRKCKFPCCREYAHPHEWARHRRFLISKRYYLGEAGLTSQETDAVLRWADLVQSHEWKLGMWNERGALHMKDKKTFRTDVVSWSAMEEHLAVLAYSKKRNLVHLAARICLEALAKNKGLYTYNQQYWGFARICVDLLKTPYTVARDGILLALQLYLRTLKIFHACFTNKCSELASAGLFPVLLDLLPRSDPASQAVVVNILVLMIMHYNYISLVVNMGVLDPLITLTSSPNDLLRRRVYGCLEVLSKNGPTQTAMVHHGLLPTLVRQLSLNNLDIILSSLLTLNSVCQNHRALVLMLAVDNHLVVKAIMRLLSEREGDMRKVPPSPVPSGSTKSLSLNDLHHGEAWCCIPRQCLVLATKLCVDRSASRLMVKRGIVGKLRTTWSDTDSIAERSLILEALAVLSRHPKAAEQICQQDFLSLLSDGLTDRHYQEQVLQLTSNLSHSHLGNILDSGILLELVTSFGDKLLHRRLFPLVLSILASTSTSDKVQALLMTNQAKAYTLLLDIAFNTTDMDMLKPCVTTLGHLDAANVPLHVVKPNSLLLVAYIDKLLKAGSDSLVLHGLLQLRDLLRVDCLRSMFREHHTHKVVQLLCEAPFKPPVQIMARAVLEQMTGQRTRRASSTSSNERFETSPSTSSGQGQSQGHSQGHSQGYCQGHSQGYSQGHSQGHSQGYNQSHSQGHSHSQGQGHSQVKGQTEVSIATATGSKTIPTGSGLTSSQVGNTFQSPVFQERQRRDPSTEKKEDNNDNDKEERGRTDGDEKEVDDDYDKEESRGSDDSDRYRLSLQRSVDDSSVRVHVIHATDNESEDDDDDDDEDDDDDSDDNDNDDNVNNNNSTGSTNHDDGAGNEEAERDVREDRGNNGNENEAGDDNVDGDGVDDDGDDDDDGFEIITMGGEGHTDA